MTKKTTTPLEIKKLLNDSPVKEEMVRAIRKYAELNNNENNTN